MALVRLKLFDLIFSHSAITIARNLQRNPTVMCPRCKVERTDENQIQLNVPKVDKGASRRFKAIKKLRKIKKPNSKQKALLQKLLERKNGYIVSVTSITSSTYTKGSILIVQKVTCTICGYWIKKPPERIQPEPEVTEEPEPAEVVLTEPKKLPPVLHNLFPIRKVQDSKTKQSKVKPQSKNQKNLKAKKPKLKGNKAQPTVSKVQEANHLLKFLKIFKR